MWHAAGHSASFAAVGAHALWPLGVAVIFAFFMLTTRQIAKETDPIGLQALSGVIACTILAPILAIGEWRNIPELQLIRPDIPVLLLLAAIGILELPRIC